VIGSLGRSGMIEGLMLLMPLNNTVVSLKRARPLLHVPYAPTPLPFAMASRVR
jgi:hypothetical protein